MKTVELSEIEIVITMQALNEYWNKAATELANGKTLMSDGSWRPLGDIERDHRSTSKVVSYGVMNKLNEL